MSEVEKAQALERFFRGPNASRSASEGSGLELPIVRAIIQAHGGEVTLEDRLGSGLRVFLHFPINHRLDLVWDKDATASRSA